MRFERSKKVHTDLGNDSTIVYTQIHSFTRSQLIDIRLIFSLYGLYIISTVFSRPFANSTRHLPRGADDRIKFYDFMKLLFVVYTLVIYEISRYVGYARCARIVSFSPSPPDLILKNFFHHARVWISIFLKTQKACINTRIWQLKLDSCLFFL